MWILFAAVYGEDVYNGSVYSATTDAIADSGGGSLASTGIFAAVFIIVGLSIIAVTVLAQYRRKQSVVSIDS